MWESRNRPMYYECHGGSDPGTPTVLLSSGLGGAAQYWAPQIPALARHFRVIAYDQTGTGRSPGMLPDGYNIADMAAEVAALLDELQVTKTHFVGHALGGLIGLQLAVSRPDLLNRMVLVNAWTKTHSHTIRCFGARKSLLLNTGIEAYVAAQPLFLYPAAWLASRQDWLLEQDAAAVAHFPPVETVLRRIGAVEAFDLAARIPEVTISTLVIATRDDLLVPCGCSAELAEALPHGRLVLLDHGGHACNITDAAGFDAQIEAFLLEA